MILTINNLTKSIGPKDLYENLSFSVAENEKIGFIGRNGTGKTTMFRLIAGMDSDFTGNISIPLHRKIVLTQQEFNLDDDIFPLKYILDEVPRYIELKTIIDNYESSGSTDDSDIANYTQAVHEFSELGYYDIEDRIIDTLDNFGIPVEKSISPMKILSGGEKRFVELTKVIYSQADLALIDEPTNHMDYVGKEKFISWLRNYAKAIIVITHDRDVLEVIDRIIEIKNKQIVSYRGNYESYLKQNSINNLTGIRNYELQLFQLEELKEKIEQTKVLKLQTSSIPAKQSLAKREQRYREEYEKKKNELEKPDFWIDKDSLTNLSKEVADSYNEYKSSTIDFRLKANFEQKSKTRKFGNLELLEVEKLSLGYSEDDILINNLYLKLSFGDRIHIKGRNGTGKSSFLKYILAQSLQIPRLIPESITIPQCFSGSVKWTDKSIIGVYEQEFNVEDLKKTIREFIFDIHVKNNIEIGDQKLKEILSSYMFDPDIDKELKISNCSGGQKARLQLIKMRLKDPNVLILDEPTNHLDLPSIEELEQTLTNFSGAVIYVSHDNYFCEKIGGRVIKF